MDIKKTPEAEIIVSEVLKRFRKGRGTNIFIIGLSGTGKSSTSIRLAELIIIAKEGNGKFFIIYSLLELLETLRKVEEGDVIVIEEVSVLFPSRRFMGKENVAINKVFDTIRKKRLCLISNAPILPSIDSHMRAMGHILIETENILKKEQIVVSNVILTQTNPRSGKTYYHKFVRDDNDVDLIYTKKPNSKVWKGYEARKDKEMEDLYNSLRLKQKFEQDKEKKQMSKLEPTNLNDPKTLEELKIIHMRFTEKKTLQQIANELGYKRGQSILNKLRKLEKNV